MDSLAPENFLDLAKTQHQTLFENCSLAWEPLTRIAAYLASFLRPAMLGTVTGGSPFIGSAVYIGKGTRIEPGAVIKGPAWIGEDCEIRAGCYIRENVIAGNGCVLGNSCEFKNCVIFDGAQIPHFNYVGDSILGAGAHLGAGVILSNVRLDRAAVTIPIANGERLETGLRKFGAIIGDHAEIGCNSVLSPGSVIGRRSIIYPCTHWIGILPENSICRTRVELAIVPRREI
jgi:bifunctional N-acetylglucosamine-1-phosphate-uridyltransferase/glucosamine-1-phosphate-acetyltransferase GlmU-like protein